MLDLVTSKGPLGPFSFYANNILTLAALNISMAKSFLDSLREQLEEVKSPVVFFMSMCLIFSIVGALALTGVYFYTRH